jgi:UDP-N-acetyl-D-mannosaminuronate dehydrogenase
MAVPLFEHRGTINKMDKPPKSKVAIVGLGYVGLPLSRQFARSGAPVLGEVPKLVGGLTPACLRKAVQVYSQAIKTVVPVSSCRVAEAAKLLEISFEA